MTTDCQQAAQPTEQHKAEQPDLARICLRKRRAAALARIDGDASGILIDKKWCSFSDSAVKVYYLDLPYRAGLAFSGGGIRSATIALGLSEALAARGRLYAFDMLSTVSGGGYFGSFLRALHVPRGAPEAEADIIADRLGLADATMTSLPDQQYFRADSGNSAFVTKGRAVKNPLWWLRENGRYLAPAGMSDYGFAVAYMLRNWGSLLLFLLSVVLIAFALMQVAVAGLVEHLFQWDALTLSWPAKVTLRSPLIALVGLWSWITVGVAGSYWFSTPLSDARVLGAAVKSDVLGTPAASLALRPPAGANWSRVTFTVAFVALFLLVILLADAADKLPRDPTASLWIFGLKIALATALTSAAATSLRSKMNTPVDFRREQTRLLSKALVVLAVLTAAAAIDCTALSVRVWLHEGTDAQIVTTGALSGVLTSVLSFLIAKLPDWFGGRGSALGKFFVAHARHFALLAALSILFSVALLADTLAIKLLWHGIPYLPCSHVDWKVFGIVVGLLGIVTVAFSSSLNFANLLALTPFYGSRLTRTFIGGSNVHRLDAARRSEVTEGLGDDDIALQHYMEAECAAPLHLINVTRNRTIGEPILHERIDVARDDPLVLESAGDPRGRLASYESSLTLHDRQGDRMVFGPFGLRVGAEFYDWKQMEKPPSLGLLCAISGAAVGAGMGRMTSLGSSMAFTLANVRLGYWWSAPRTASGTEANAARPTLSRLFPSLVCLTKELLGRFGTSDYWFLSDGGHSENTGVLTLLERGCRFILALDNGQDKDFLFSDLEILIRTARTDIGLEVIVVEPREFPTSFEPVRSCFLNGADGDWRVHARTDDHPGFALLLKVVDIPRRVNGVWKRRRGGNGWIVWLKPRRFGGLAADVETYADANEHFPQQATSNQFFDEAQWESYRRLGFEMGRRLFGNKASFDPFLPVIYQISGSGTG